VNTPQQHATSKTSFGDPVLPCPILIGYRGLILHVRIFKILKRFNPLLSMNSKNSSPLLRTPTSLTRVSFRTSVRQVSCISYFSG
jgi:hypothetical protein